MGQPTRALAALQSALERTDLAEYVVRDGGFVALPFVIGTVYLDLGDHDMALAYFRRAAAQAVGQHLPINASFSLTTIAHLQLQQGHVEEALATYRQAVEMNRKARYADGSAHACRSLGEALVGLDRHEEALPHLGEAAALFAQLEDRANEAVMWRRLAAVHERLGAPEEAREAWGRVRELHRAAMDVAGEAEAAEGMARAERRLPAAAENVVARYEEALALAARAGDRRRELTLHNSLGIVHWERGAYADAARHYEAALRLCRDAGDRVHEGLMLNSLGATLHRLGRLDEARTALGEGVRVTKETGERQLQAHALATLGEVCLASGRLDEAHSSVDASLALRRALGDRRGEGWMFERLSRVRAAAGAHDAARDAADAGLAIAHEIGDETLRAAVARLRSSTATTDSPNP
ncbi:MAG: tetratricopeptide repeat protein [Gemmatimonadaceae bacterium]